MPKGANTVELRVLVAFSTKLENGPSCKPLTQPTDFIFLRLLFAQIFIDQLYNLLQPVFAMNK